MIRKVVHYTLILFLLSVLSFSCQKKDNNSTTEIPCTNAITQTNTILFCPNTIYLDSAHCIELKHGTPHRIGLAIDSYNNSFEVSFYFDSLAPPVRTYTLISDINSIDSVHASVGVLDGNGEIWNSTAGEVIFKKVNGHPSATTNGNITLTKKGTSVTKTLSGNLTCRN